MGVHFIPPYAVSARTDARRRQPPNTTDCNCPGVGRHAGIRMLSASRGQAARSRSQRARTSQQTADQVYGTFGFNGVPTLKLSRAAVGRLGSGIDQLQ